MITKKVKDEQIERKEACIVSFVKVFKFQYNKFKVVQENLWKMLIKNISWKTHQS